MSKPTINSCNMPKPMPRNDAIIWQRLCGTLLKAHCDDKRPADRCAGRISIDRKGITLNCPRCGDARQLYAQTVTNTRTGEA